MIDVHTHVVPAGLPFGVHAPGPWPRLEVGDPKGEVYTGDRHFRTVSTASWELSRRLDDMEAHGVDRQVLSPMPELFCYWAEPQAAARYCRGVNGWIAEAVRSRPDRFGGFGILPLQDPGVATSMLSEVAALGLAGVELGSNVEGVPLHDPRFGELFAEAAGLGLTVFVHAFHPCGAETITGGPAASAVTFPNEIGFALGGLLAEGVVHRNPALRLCGSHGGGSLAMILARFDRMWRFDPALAERLPAAPSELARRLWVDLLVFDARTLRFVIDTVGPERVVVGSDYPFMPDRPGLVLDDLTDLPDPVRDLLTHHNARRLLGEA